MMESSASIYAKKKGTRIFNAYIARPTDPLLTRKKKKATQLFKYCS